MQWIKSSEEAEKICWNKAYIFSEASRLGAVVKLQYNYTGIFSTIVFNNHDVMAIVFLFWVYIT